jgi:hypothetical protein
MHRDLRFAELGVFFRFGFLRRSDHLTDLL